jgi:hypothetical protein
MSEEPPQSAASEDSVVTPLRKRYEAFTQARDSVPRLALCVGDGVVSILYYEIGDILYDGIKDEVSFAIRDRHDVKISGGNLRRIFSAIHVQECLLVQEFDARRFLPPGNANDPFVERIELSEPKPKAAKEA